MYIADQTLRVRGGFAGRSGRGVSAVALAGLLLCWAAPLFGQQHAADGDSVAPAAMPAPTSAPAKAEADLQARVEKLEMEVAELRQLLRGNGGANVAARADAGATGEVALASGPSVSAAASAGVTSADVAPAPSASGELAPDDRKNLDFLRDATINVGLDGYYSYNFNAPVGRVNVLRAYDVLSNNFSLNQASIVLEDAPNLAEGRRFGARVDLQFGQATDTLQGNPVNEPRPDIYRNIFQAYGTYVAPFGKGLTIDFGKWSSSIGIEGNYTKDQMNYSRSYYFNFLPFYHMGIRANYPVNDRFTLTYWVVNGTNQAEATNGFKDELFGFTAKPAKSVTWVVNYYLGQEHPDRENVSPYSPIPVQPGLSFVAIRPAPNGRLHIFDSYATWQVAPKLSFALEGDYVIERLWRNEAPGESDSPSHVIGGAAYTRYEFSSRFAAAARAEYLSDRGGLFSGVNQALKETTATFDYKLADGFLMRYEWRRDFSNRPSFLTDTQGLLSKEQTTASVGLIWWWGRKEGAW
jgi:putative OmpL-like beta-barrel porin-2